MRISQEIIYEFVFFMNIFSFEFCIRNKITHHLLMIYVEDFFRPTIFGRSIQGLKARGGNERQMKGTTGEFVYFLDDVMRIPLFLSEVKQLNLSGDTRRNCKH